MKSNLNNPTFTAWLEEAERFAVRADDAQLALAAVGARHHANEHAYVASLLCQLARVAGDCASAVIENGRRTSPTQVGWGREAAVLLSRGWDLYAVASEGAR